MCDEGRSAVILKTHGQTVEIPLTPLSNPVGAVYFEGKLWVACFGGSPQPGLAVIDVTSKTLEAAYPYPPGTFIHNVYAFNWGASKEIFVADLGNPWASPPISGQGLVRFDRNSKSFVTDTTVGGLNARSAVQEDDGVFYVLTQEGGGAPTQLARLELQDEKLVVVANTFLAPRNWGDGGADVFLGQQPNTVFCTDRVEASGKLYHYEYDGSFQQKGSWTTGSNPRYTTMVDDDIVSCNQWGSSMTIFKGLAADPATAVQTQEVPAPAEVSFLLVE